METKRFPSPCGVSFILILANLDGVLKDRNTGEFPSPYGVSFILIMYVLMVIYGYIHSMFPSPYGVSFILIW